MRMAYSEVFETRGERITPRVPVRLAGVVMDPGRPLEDPLDLNGFDLAAIRGRDLEVWVRDGLYVISAFYRDGTPGR